MTAKLAGVSFPSKYPIDALLSDVAAALAACGFRLGGVAQVVSSEPGRHVDVVRLRDLRDGSETRILQELGREARGCRLDPTAIARVAGHLERTLEEGCDLLIINRFGRGESEGHGLRHILERAVAMGIPVLVGVRADYAEAWAEFHGGLAADLACDRDAVLAWAESVCRHPDQAELIA